MGVLMKKLILACLIVSSSYAQNYTFLLNKYDKELELESKIIAKIMNSTVKNDPVLFIPEVKESEKYIYSKIVTLGKTCNTSNFIFIKRESDSSTCKEKHKFYFTNNYKKLLSDEKFFGAFFWSKSRPNIVFIKNRLEKNNITLPNSYLQFVEDI